MEKSIKKLIKEYKKLKPNCKVKYIKEHYASLEIYNSGGLISVLEPFEFRQEIDFLKTKQ
jgi:hypothetical protein